MSNIIINDLIRIFNHCVTAVSPQNLIRNSLKYNPTKQNLTVVNKKYDLQNKNVYVIGTGKAVFNMAKETEAILGSKIKEGIISIPVGSTTGDVSNGDIYYFEGAENNLPDDKAEATARKINNLVKSLNHNDLLLVLISGGGSALLPLPHEDLTMPDKLAIIKKLANAGADITELNTVRKKLSSLKGGQLAIAAQPAEVVSLILSDIVGDPLDLIASGPTSKNNDNPLKAKEVLQKYNLYNVLSDKVKNVVNKTPKLVDFPTNNVYNHIIGSNALSMKSAIEKAKDLNLYPIQISSEITGNVQKVAQEYAKLTTLVCNGISKVTSKDAVKSHLKAIDIPSMSRDLIDHLCNIKGKSICLIFGGETTVEVKGSGKGGRNQQLALEYSKVMHQLKVNLNNFEIYFLSAGTDGIDGPTDAAGAIGYLSLITEAENEGLDVDYYLKTNDSYNFYRKFKKGALHVITGHTNTNVMDIHLIIIKQKSITSSHL